MENSCPKEKCKWWDEEYGCQTRNCCIREITDPDLFEPVENADMSKMCKVSSKLDTTMCECEKCGKPIDTEDAWFPKEDVVYCAECYDEYTAKKTCPKSPNGEHYFSHNENTAGTFDYCCFLCGKKPDSPRPELPQLPEIIRPEDLAKCVLGILDYLKSRENNNGI